MHRTSTRQKQMTLKELEAKKLKLERRFDNIKRELVDVTSAINWVIEDLNKSLQANELTRV
jgi:hypothetical protein